MEYRLSRPNWNPCKPCGLLAGNHSLFLYRGSETAAVVRWLCTVCLTQPPSAEFFCTVCVSWNGAPTCLLRQCSPSCVLVAPAWWKTGSYLKAVLCFDCDDICVGKSVICLFLEEDAVEGNEIPSIPTLTTLQPGLMLIGQLCFHCGFHLRMFCPF